MDFEDIYTQVMERCHHSVTGEPTLLAIVKSLINARYQEAWGYLWNHRPLFGMAEHISTTVDSYSTGNVTTNETTAITGVDTVWTSAMIGRKFKLDSFEEVYEIATVPGITSLTLTKAVNDDADSDLAYLIYQDEIALPSDCFDIICIRQEITSAILIKLGLTELRKKQIEQSVSVDPLKITDPIYWAFLDTSNIVVYPAPYRQINLKIDYAKKITELAAADSTTLLPIEFHKILVCGGMADLYEYDDDQRYQEKDNKFYEMLANLVRKNAIHTDRTTIRPNVIRT